MNAYTDHTDTNARTAITDRSMSSDHGRLLSAGTLKNTNVVNLAGESLGSIEDIMFHVDTGDVAYAVVSFGGFLGMGNKLFAVPWEALSVDTDDRHIVLNVDRDRLEDAPGFDKDAWPTTADEGWLKDLHLHYGGTYAPRVRVPHDQHADEPFSPFSTADKR